jgi:hypothetical protein
MHQRTSWDNRASLTPPDSYWGDEEAEEAAEARERAEDDRADFRLEERRGN